MSVSNVKNGSHVQYGITDYVIDTTSELSSLPTGISMGSVIGQNIAGMMGGAFQDLNNQMINEPQKSSHINTDSRSLHEACCYIKVNGKTIGPISENVLNQMISSGITIEKIWFGTEQQG